MRSRTLVACAAATALFAATAEAQTPTRTILAIGAHAGDVELTMGQTLIHQRLAGDRVVILHLTAGEGGNPKLAAEQYDRQKRAEAQVAAQAIGAELIWGPYRDGHIPDDEAGREYVAEIIGQVKPTHILTHWKRSIHKDHSRTHALVVDAVLLASLAGTRTVRGIYYAENWEDAEGFRPYLYIDTSDAHDAWLEAIRSYEFVRGGISSFSYLSYYDALAIVRGAEARKPRASAFEIDDIGKKRVLDRIQ